jgi:hypothetical protein
MKPLIIRAIETGSKRCFQATSLRAGAAG